VSDAMTGGENDEIGRAASRARRLHPRPRDVGGRGDVRCRDVIADSRRRRRISCVRSARSGGVAARGPVRGRAGRCLHGEAQREQEGGRSGRAPDARIHAGIETRREGCPSPTNARELGRTPRSPDAGRQWRSRPAP
jgi:hypothetical protein